MTQSTLIEVEEEVIREEEEVPPLPPRPSRHIDRSGRRSLSPEEKQEVRLNLESFRSRHDSETTERTPLLDGRGYDERFDEIERDLSFTAHLTQDVIRKLVDKKKDMMRMQQQTRNLQNVGVLFRRNAREAQYESWMNRNRVSSCAIVLL